MWRKFLNYWKQNATKRWLLALDRFAIVALAFIGFQSAIEQNLELVADSTAMCFFLGALILFIILYTPSYMFPTADEEVKR